MRWLWASAAILTGTAPASADPCVNRGDLGDPCAEVCEPAPATKPIRAPFRGVLVSKTTGEPAIGATIVATQTGVSGEEVAITNETGAYSMELAPGIYDLTIYYNNKASEIRSVFVSGDARALIYAIDDSPDPDACPFECCMSIPWHIGGPDYGSEPRFGLRTDRNLAPVSRDRTHRAWIAPAAAADPRTAVTTIDEGPRLQRAPGVPLAFVEDVTTYTSRIPIAQPSGVGGATAVALRGATNTTRGDARMVLGLDREGASGGLEALASGPLKRDKLWLTTGLVANRGSDDELDAHGMVQVHYAKTEDHQLAVVGLAQGHGSDVRDGWANARWVSKLREGKLELHAIATAEQLTLPSDVAALATEQAAHVTNRAGGRGAAKLRTKLLGYHQLELTAGGGGGVRGDTRHDDGFVAVGDEWQPFPNIQLHAGVRADARQFGDARAKVVSPRVSLAYDFTKEGRSDLFVAYQRVPRLDDGLPGDWLAADARFHDELAAGASYFPTHSTNEFPFMFGVGGRARWVGEADAELGVETWIRWDKGRTKFHASATTLGSVGTIVAQRVVIDRKANKLYAAGSARVSPDRDEGGLGIVWRHRGDRNPDPRGTDDLGFEFALEGYGGTDGPGARMLLGATW